MKLKIRSGKDLVFSPDKSYTIDVYRDRLIVNLQHRWSFKGFRQRKNILVIDTVEGPIRGVFTGVVPMLSFDYQNKDQLVFSVILTNDLDGIVK